jgi:hypothetical protein
MLAKFVLLLLVIASTFGIATAAAKKIIKFRARFACVSLYIPTNEKDVRVEGIRTLNDKGDCHDDSRNFPEGKKYIVTTRYKGKEVDTVRVVYAAEGLREAHSNRRTPDLRKLITIGLGQKAGPKIFEVKNPAGKIVFSKPYRDLLADDFFSDAFSNIFIESVGYAAIASDFKSGKLNSTEAIQRLLKRLGKCKEQVKEEIYAGSCEAIKIDAKYALKYL